MNLVYFHTGEIFPEYIYDSIYQAILWNDNSLKIWILADWKYIPNIEKELSRLDNQNNIQFRCVANEMLQENIPDISFNKDFRGNFWGHTLSRFFYIYELIKTFDLEHVFHVENDVLVYKNFISVYNKYVDLLKDKLVAVQDSESRAICSYVYIHDKNVLENFLSYAKDETANFTEFKNDMQLMGGYQDKNSFNCLKLGDDEYLFDGAAIGQYLGGVDPRNSNGQNTKGFVNETSQFKADEYVYEKIYQYGLNSWICKKDDTESDVVNLHVHSKNLPEFSSKINLFNLEDFKLDFSIPFERQIVTGELIMNEMDVIFVNGVKFLYDYKYYQKPLNSLVIKINEKYSELSENKLRTIEKLITDLNVKVPKVFVYGDNLKEWYTNIFKRLKLPKIDLYCHNSDENIYKDELIDDLLKNESVNAFYSQNLSTMHEKARILPIGVANSCWEHGDLYALKDVLYKNYKYKKIDKIYVNFNENTYIHRKKYKESLKNLKEQSIMYIEDKELPYKDYLNRLVKYKYCFCPRGNGLDTHRFWEAIYLGVIPIVINNKSTNSVNFIKLLKQLNIKFIELQDVYELPWIFLNKN